MVTIRNIRTITSAPAGINLVVVKIETSEPNLYGLGCATFTQRYKAVVTAVDEYLKPLLIGREVARIEEHFQLMMVSAYWRNGPVLNNAISGVDQALWDIKGKMAGMPIYDLLGGKCRDAAAIYRHADGGELSQISENIQRYLDEGVRHIRVQRGGYGGLHEVKRPEGALEGNYYDPRLYTRAAIEAIAHVRNDLGDEVEILHDVHERLDPVQAVEFARELEQYRLFFLEDLLAPEDLEWFENVRAVCTTPQAMGELFNHPREWTPLISGRQIDYMRMHISQMGGITPARKVAALGEIYGVRTAWHGPGDVSPVGHAANLHLDLACPNFGIQEWIGNNEQLMEVFPGMPQDRNGYLYPNDQPGMGIDLDEKTASKYPAVPTTAAWTEARLPDGTIHRP